MGMKQPRSGPALWRYDVSHPDYGTVSVISIGPDTATLKAAEVWDVRWQEVAGYCSVTKRGPAETPRCKRCGREFGAPGTAAAYCPDCVAAMEAYRRDMRRVRTPDRRAGMRE